MNDGPQEIPSSQEDRLKELDREVDALNNPIREQFYILLKEALIAKGSRESISILCHRIVPEAEMQDFTFDDVFSVVQEHNKQSISQFKPAIHFYWHDPRTNTPYDYVVDLVDVAVDPAHKLLAFGPYDPVFKGYDIRPNTDVNLAIYGFFDTGLSVISKNQYPSLTTKQKDMVLSHQQYILEADTLQKLFANLNDFHQSTVIPPGPSTMILELA